MIEADTEQARAEREAGRRRRYVAVTPTDEFGLRTVIAPVVPADGVWLDAIVDRVADALDARRDLIPDLPADCTRDELRSVALGWLAHPEDVVALLAGEAEPRGHGAKTRRAVVHVHLHQAALEGTPCVGGVARVEEIGPLLLDELAQLLGHARITLDRSSTSTSVSVNGYEHPDGQGPAPAYAPWATCSRTPHDQPPGTWTIPTPTTRTAHRARPGTTTRPRWADDTIGPRPTWRIGRQLGLDRYLWRTPHGLYRLVDATGTHELDTAQALELAHPGALDAALKQIEAGQRHRSPEART